MNSPRIVSLLPAATEMACVLGLEQSITGISFECDYPPAISDRPHVVDTSLDTRKMTPRQIDVEVTAIMRNGGSLYVIDEELLKRLRPDIILTQNLCQVCATSGNDLSQVLDKLDYKPQVIFMSPHSITDIEGNLLELAAATGTEARAGEIIDGWHKRIDAVKNRAADLKRRPRVFLMEWVDPIYCSGHWLPEMTEIAGGVDELARKGVDSVRMDWQDVVKWQPEILIVAPCGYNKEQSEKQMKLLYDLPGWNSIPAVKAGRVHPVDSNSCFVRPGPRVIDGIELLSGLFN